MSLNVTHRTPSPAAPQQVFAAAAASGTPARDRNTGCSEPGSIARWAPLPAGTPALGPRTAPHTQSSASSRLPGTHRGALSEQRPPRPCVRSLGSSGSESGLGTVRRHRRDRRSCGPGGARGLLGVVVPALLHSFHDHPSKNVHYASPSSVQNFARVRPQIRTSDLCTVAAH